MSKSLTHRRPASPPHPSWSWETRPFFTNTSTGDNLIYLWDFGDSSTSTETSPSHTYATTGTFTVTLTVSNGAGMDMATAVVEVIPSSNPPLYTLFLPVIVAAAPE
ncbi:MAG: PKD domain-containing protein [Anaerolineae bacterium]|nr:PKD domain-containing protein [Anaerolineae bacterium]